MRTFRNASLSVSPSHLSAQAYESVPKIVSNLTLLLCFYLAAPLFVVPIVKLSLSAPIAFLLVLEIYKRFSGLQPNKVALFTSLLSAILIMWGLSLAWSQIFGEQVPELDTGVILLLRYAYWFIMGIAACRLFQTTDLPGKAAEAFGWGCITMAVTILIEFIGFGGLLTSGWSVVSRLSQNGYGWQFSAFFPFVLYLGMVSKGKKKGFAIAGLLVVLLAIMLNASRSSWGTAVLALCLFLLLTGLANRSGYRIKKFVVGFSCLAIVAVISFNWLPENLKKKAFSRAVTSSAIEQDKSWLIRLLMIQKGQRIFAENPIFGVGPGQFTNSYVELDIPDRLSYAGGATFNEKSAHNSYVMLLAEGGLAIMIPFCIMLLWLVTSGLRAAIGLAKYGQLWVIPLFTSLICFSIHFWSVSGITSTAPWFMYGFCASMIMRYHQLKYYSQTVKC